MTRIRSSWLAFASGLALSAAAPAQMARSVDPLFEAAGRGDVVPIERALAEETRPDVRALLLARLAAARFDPRATQDPALARLAQADADPDQRRAALGVLMSAAFVDGDYAEAARLGRLLEASLAAGGPADLAEETARTRSVAELLAVGARQSVEGSVVAGAVPAHYDRVGLPRIGVVVNGQLQEAVVDTGANLSVLSRETARRLGIQVRDAQTRVGNGVDGTVSVRVGVADRFEIAGTVLRNVSFLVIDDEQLTFPLPGGYDIRAIVGLPVLRALQRIRIENSGRFVVGPQGSTITGPSNLRASGNNLFVDVEIGGDSVPLHFDTGANLTRLSAVYAAAHPEIVAGLETEEARMASAGGARRAQVATWRHVPLTVAGRTLQLPELLVELLVDLPADGPEPRFYGTLGSNVLRAFESYTIDFATMRLELGPPAADRMAAP